MIERYDSPLGPVLANIFVGYYDQKLMSSLTDNTPLCYFRYIDDTYAIFENEEACQHSYVLLSSLHYSPERESSGSGTVG